MKKKKLKINKKTKRPRVLVLSGYGLNCEEETKFAFEQAGGKADIVHLNDLVAKPEMLSKYQILAFPGGFAYGDDTGSGKAYANKFKNHLSKHLEKFLARDTLIIGICNGFQIVTNLGILPGGLAQNKNKLYIDRWVDLKVLPPAKGEAGRGSSPWLKNIKKISMPIAHGEGRYVIPEREYTEMLKRGEIAFKYEKGDICRFQNLEENPNGSDFGIAGVLAYNGRVLGMMPHPERAMFTHQNPMWFSHKLNSNRKDLPSEALAKEGEGIQIFINAIKYFSAKGGSASGGKHYE